ncbi:MAG: hypothetical protein D3923_14195, partial [Candidatus Electrothrix sp. AR3]|nr:hypothetical protein [Candidatus Electrothrix sp. AR3]
ADKDSYENWVELHPSQVQHGDVQKQSEYSRVRREGSLFDWGEMFKVSVHSTPIFQDGPLIRLYKTSCPYPSLTKTCGRYFICTNESESQHSRINYYVGAILFLKNRGWAQQVSSEPTGHDIFKFYDDMITNSIKISKAESDKKPMLALAQRKKV